jgi:hypothetical protein
MKKPQWVEPFADFVRDHPHEGKPWLAAWKNRKTWHVHWGDGDLHRYIEFRAALDAEALSAKLQALFDEARPTLSYKSTLVSGGVHGCWTYCPASTAVRVVELVQTFFTDALSKSWEPCVGCGVSGCDAWVCSAGIA